MIVGTDHRPVDTNDMSHLQHDKNKLLNRVRRLRGQVDAIERALDNEDDCSEILHVIVAARGAINGLMTHVIEGHILEHLLDDAGHSTATRRRDADELIAALKTYIK